MKGDKFKMKKKLIVFIFSVVMMMTFATSSFAASCGNWQTYSTSNWCSTTVWCGPLNWNDAWMLTQYQNRLCVNPDNTTYWEYRIISDRTGQCC